MMNRPTIALNAWLCSALAAGVLASGAGCSSDDGGSMPETPDVTENDTEVDVVDPLDVSDDTLLPDAQLDAETQDVDDGDDVAPDVDGGEAVDVQDTVQDVIDVPDSVDAPDLPLTDVEDTTDGEDSSDADADLDADVELDADPPTDAEPDSDTDVADAETDSAALCESLETAPLSLSLGTGIREWLPIEDGQEITMAEGIQGGVHVWGSLSGTGFGTLRNEAEFEIVAADGERLGALFSTGRFECNAEAETLQSTGLTVFINLDFDPMDLDGREATIRTTLTTESGDVLTDERDVVLRCCDWLFGEP